jgi:hypothetical protein
LALKDGKQFDIEVRTAIKNPRTQKVYYPKKSIKAKYLALVTKDEITYVPEIV